MGLPKLATSVAVATALFALAGRASAQVEGTFDESAAKPATPKKVATAPAPAPAPAPARAPAQPADADVTSDGSSATFPMPDHRFELGGRLGVILPGEVTPKGFAEGKTSAGIIALADFNAIVHPFFTVGAYFHASKQDYERSSGGRVIGKGDFTLISLGVSAKGRLPITTDLVARAGLTIGRNFISASGTSSSGSFDASGGGLAMALTGELAYQVTSSVALTAQLGFASQVSGSVTVAGKDADLAFAPMFFTTAGPELRF